MCDKTKFVLDTHSVGGIGVNVVLDLLEFVTLKNITRNSLQNLRHRACREKSLMTFPGLFQIQHSEFIIICFLAKNQKFIGICLKIHFGS